MSGNSKFEALLMGSEYPLVRDFLAYGLGMVSQDESREQLSPGAVPTDIDDIEHDDVERMVRFAKDCFGVEFDDLANMNGHPFHRYIGAFLQTLQNNGILSFEACETMRRSLPSDW